ncbi:MAG: ABC transporter permease, partial [Verrucomicrobiales bacterium]
MNWILLQNSLVVSGSATILALAVGFVAALFASSRSKPVQMVVLASSLLVLALPPFLVTNTWMHYFGLTGVWRAFLDWNVYSLSGTILLLALSFWPIGFLLFYSALKKVTRAQLELDPELRGNRLLKWVIIPALKDSAIVAAAAIFVLAFNNFTIPALLQVKVYPAELWLRFNVNFNFLEALQLGWPMLLGPLCLLLIAQSKEIDFRFKGGVVMESALLNKRLGAPWLVVSCLLSAALIFFAAFLPLFQLATSARTFVELAPAFLAGKSALFNSVVISTLAALAALFLSLFSRKIKTIGGLAWVIYLAPGILLGITLVFIFNRPATTAFYQSLGLVIFGLAVRYLAPVWSGWRVAQQTIPQGWNEVMKLHGGSSFQRFQFLDLPSLHRQVFALFFIAYIFCLWDVETLIFFVPAGKETLSIRIFNMLHYGHATQGNA